MTKKCHSYFSDKEDWNILLVYNLPHTYSDKCNIHPWRQVKIIKLIASRFISMAAGFFIFRRRNIYHPLFSMQLTNILADRY